MSWRSWIGPALVVALVIQALRNAEPSPPRPALVGALTLAMIAGWVIGSTRWLEAGIWILGLASAGLMLVVPGSAAVVGIAGAMILAGLRLDVRRGAIAAVALSAAYLIAFGLATQWSSWFNLAFPALGLAFAYMTSASVRRIRLERERAEALLEELQRTRAAEIERAALAERTRIAREIHDVLAHTLSALAVQLEGTRLLLEQRPGDPAAVAAVERAHRLASEGLAEARRAIGALRGDTLPGPDGLARLVDEFSEATGTPGHFEVSGEPIALASEARLAVYRTAQEALTNVQKHARDATAVDVRLSYTSEGAELVVEDFVAAAVSDSRDRWRSAEVNPSGGPRGLAPPWKSPAVTAEAALDGGQGGGAVGRRDSPGVTARVPLDGGRGGGVAERSEGSTATADGNGSTGYGLIGMRERAELAGGTLEAGALPTGFRVRLWLPKA